MFLKELTRDPETGDFTSLSRMDPGCDTSIVGVMFHHFWEEVYILSGSLYDLRLRQEFRAGQYACRPPGMLHGPFIAKEGCLTFQVCYFPK